MSLADQMKSALNVPVFVCLEKIWQSQAEAANLNVTAHNDALISLQTPAPVTLLFAEHWETYIKSNSLYSSRDWQAVVHKT